MTGIANAPVFPDPVLALHRTSLPSSNKGIDFSCIRVGSTQPNFAIPWKIHIHT